MPTTIAQQSVSEIPVAGFGTDSEFAKKGLFRDETVEEREKWEELNGDDARTCDREFAFGGERGYCTRVRGHIQEGANGMHLAGDGQKIVGAW